jgi:hypothetical protein
VLSLADENIEPGCDGEHVGYVIKLLGTLIARSANRVPDIPFVETNGRFMFGLWFCSDVVGPGVVVEVTACEIDERCCDLYGAFGGSGAASIGVVSTQRCQWTKFWC